MSEFASVGNLGFRNPPAALPEQPGIRTMQLSFNSDGAAVYKPVAGNGEGIDINVVSCDGGGGEKRRKKRGRARKYTPPQPEGGAVEFTSGVFETARDDHVRLQNQQQQVGEQGGGAVETMRKKGGRPPGSVNKKQVHEQQQQLDDLGSPGTGFTPHVITVNTGEDVSSKIMSFSQNGPRAICILSAIGTISSVTLSQAATPGGSVTYEGRFEILSLSGSFMLSENGGGRSRTGGLSVSLAGPDGFVVGGGVAGLLTAASPVQNNRIKQVINDPSIHVNNNLWTWYWTTAAACFIFRGANGSQPNRKLGFPLSL
ncbi:AT-hook motif nuclear-localized protein 8 isoform X2 [Silene latifolia]|uniref:AT-hook motif nuclear-localized protein 8 isoform X2 n=1 Tax=Silene latifolia TaxID=37657 RepID=UPI003D783BB2